jgi:hypothetical protein
VNLLKIQAICIGGRIPSAPASVKALRFAPTAARRAEGRAVLTDASAAGVAGHEEHVCSSVLKENRSATVEPSSGMGGPAAAR